jgi:hypothetical protein
MALPPNIYPLGACKKMGKYCDLRVSMFGVNSYFYIGQSPNFFNFLIFGVISQSKVYELGRHP